MMTAGPRQIQHAQERKGPQPREDHAPPKKAGRPKGAPSTLVNRRIPVDLLARLDRYIDHLEGRTGLKANRGMIARRALEVFLGPHTPGPSAWKP